MADEIRVRIGSEHDILIARQRGRELAAEEGFVGSDLTLIATAISEIARNIVEYAREGEIVLTALRNGGRQGIAVVASDRGPGIPDVGRAMQDGYSTSKSLGLGLPGAGRLMDGVRDRIRSRQGNDREDEEVDRHVATDARPLIDWAVAQAAMTGELRSGDVHVFQEFPGGVLVAVIDGAGPWRGGGSGGGSRGPGHGRSRRGGGRIPGASVSPDIEGDAGRRDEPGVVRLAHPDRHVPGCRQRRGVLVRSGQGSLPRSRERLILRGGVVGYSLPMLRTSIFPVGPGDTLVLATDGIRPGFVDAIAMGARPQQVANAVLASFGKDTDDALVLVAEVEGDRR
jgi:serine/threonine-protein kinase RsbT